MEQPDYSYGTDVWSIGCILGELLLNFIEREEAEEERPKQFLFDDNEAQRSNSCFTFDSFDDQVESNSQLERILELIGSPDDDDTKFLNKGNAER